jgi:hypothetical protein
MTSTWENEKFTAWGIKRKPLLSMRRKAKNGSMEKDGRISIYFPMRDIRNLLIEKSSRTSQAMGCGQ